MFPASVPARRLAVVLAVLTGAAVVVLSWMVPEPPAAGNPAGDDRAAIQRIEPISYERCVQQAPPSYGTRSLSNPVATGC